MKYSLNDTFITEVYKQGQGLRAEIKNGFASVAQKSHLHGLKLLVDAKLTDGKTVPAGSVIYVAEDILSTQEWAKRIKKADFLEEQEFIMIQKQHVAAIDDLKEVKTTHFTMNLDDGEGTVEIHE